MKRREAVCLIVDRLWSMFKQRTQRTRGPALFAQQMHCTLGQPRRPEHARVRGEGPCEREVAICLMTMMGHGQGHWHGHWDGYGLEPSPWRSHAAHVHTLPSPLKPFLHSQVYAALPDGSFTQVVEAGSQSF